jgi:hypothetical protein
MTNGLATQPPFHMYVRIRCKSEFQKPRSFVKTRFLATMFPGEPSHEDISPDKADVRLIYSKKGHHEDNSVGASHKDCDNV